MTRAPQQTIKIVLQTGPQQSLADALVQRAQVEKKPRKAQF